MQLGKNLARCDRRSQLYYPACKFRLALERPIACKRTAQAPE